MSDASEGGDCDGAAAVVVVVVDEVSIVSDVPCVASRFAYYCTKRKPPRTLKQTNNIIPDERNELDSEAPGVEVAVVVVVVVAATADVDARGGGNGGGGPLRASSIAEW